jgi:TP901 family phage tail tape measure protein
MATSSMTVPTTFTAIDKFSHVVAGMTNGTKAFTASMGRINQRVNSAFNSLDRFSQVALGAGVGSLFYKAGDDVIQYEKAIASLAAVTGTKVGSMTKDIESLGKEPGHSVIEITKGFEQVGSKMSEYLSNPTALKAISKQGILMAEASRMSVDDSVDNLTSLLNQFGKGYESAGMFVNKLSAGEDIGASTIPETIDVLRQFAASARMAGADVTDAIAMVQAVTKTLGKQGVGRNFRNIMVDLNTGKGMDKNKLKALSMVGINIKKMIDPATTFIDKMKELTKLSGNKQAMGMFFKKTGFEAGATFLREFKVFEDYRKHIKTHNSAIEKAAKNNDTFSYTFDRLKDAFTNFIVSNDNSNTALYITKNLLRIVTRYMGALIKTIGLLVVAIVGLKVYVGVASLITKATNLMTSAILLID